MGALKTYQVSISKHVPLTRLLQIKRDNYQGESGQDYCPFELEQAIIERSENLATRQLLALKRYEKTLANYLGLGIGGMSPPVPCFNEPTICAATKKPIEFIIRF